MIIILMGVSGAGKTTIGQLLAHDLGWQFYDADDFHSQANIDKMRSSIPLTDEDRDAWLTTLQQLIDELLHRQQSAVVACSALKRSYRARLKRDEQQVHLVYLKGTPALIRSRLESRSRHFMKADLLTSQFATLEEPQDVLTIDIEQKPETIVAHIKQSFC
ncbi:MAG: gluconokinase [Candidatus Binatia bacterium]